MSADPDAELRQVLAELRSLREDLAELREIVAGRRLSDAERALLDRALPVVYRVTAGSVFAAGDLLDYALASTADAVALREALGVRTPKQVGKLLARSVGAAINGHRIHRAGDDGGAALWLCWRNKPS